MIFPGERFCFPGRRSASAGRRTAGFTTSIVMRWAKLAPTENSNTAADHVVVLDAALAQLPAAQRARDETGQVAVLVRTDAAGSICTPCYGAWVAEATGLIELRGWPAGTRLMREGGRHNLHARIAEARQQGWLGEVDGLQISLTGARVRRRRG